MLASVDIIEVFDTTSTNISVDVFQPHFSNVLKKINFWSYLELLHLYMKATGNVLQQ